MDWPITGAESYVRETGKSTKQGKLAVAQEDCWRKIALSQVILLGLAVANRPSCLGLGRSSSSRGCSRITRAVRLHARSDGFLVEGRNPLAALFLPDRTGDHL